MKNSVLALFTVVLICSCSEQPAPQTYHNPKIGLQLTYPETWEVMKKEELDDIIVAVKDVMPIPQEVIEIVKEAAPLMLLSLSKPGTGANLSVFAILVPEEQWKDIDMNLMLQEDMVAIEEVMSGSKVTENAFPLPNYPAIHNYDVQVSMNGLKITQYHYKYWHSPYLIHITFSYVNNKEKPELIKIIKSMKIEKAINLKTEGEKTAETGLKQEVNQNDNAEIKPYTPYKTEADKGNANAQYKLALMYSQGQGVKEDNKEAVKYYRLAAEQGYADAQNDLGDNYKRGLGVKQDDKEAVKYFRLAAEQRHASAQANLGFMYVQGLGVKQDDKEAFKYFRLAAEQGNITAQFNLAAMYGQGRGVQQDTQEAIKYFRLAAEQGHAKAQDLLVELEKQE